MKQPIITIFFLIVSTISLSQSLDKINYQSQQMCKKLRDLKSNNDSTTVANFYFEELMSLQEKPDVDEKYLTTLVGRLVLNCKEFRRFFIEEDQELENIQSSIKSSDLVNFKSESTFIFEQDGQKTQLELTKTSWTETHNNGTVSKYDLQWLDENSFKIIFRYSNNKEISNLFMEDDTFIVDIVSKTPSFFTLALKMDDEFYINTVKLYPITKD